MTHVWARYLTYIYIGFRGNLNPVDTSNPLSNPGSSSTKSHRPQAEEEGGWVMAIFEKKSIYLKNSTGIFWEF